MLLGKGQAIGKSRPIARFIATLTGRYPVKFRPFEKLFALIPIAGHFYFLLTVSR
ncbi:hypothetical protein REIFOR_02198 [Reinekea forsetii]|uniref:Uncharacterized protein n=1 Tax=Reinekea forsetii TaxID=1336806 RepID=A0A2K8KTZ5_9GAMM|nr:hypothetical protein REIFOR_02198 [Reinekea forsetii]